MLVLYNNESLQESIYFSFDDKNVYESLSLIGAQYITEISKQELNDTENIWYIEGHGNYTVRCRDIELKIKKNGLINFFTDVLYSNHNLKKEYVFLHGGFVEKNGACAGFLGDSGMGKSTLISYLHYQGFNTLSDDKAIIHTKTGEIIPYSRGIMLRKGSVPFVKKYGKTSDLKKYRVGHYQRFHLNVDESNVNGHHLNCLFILNRKESGETRIEQIPHWNAVESVLKQSIDNKDIFKQYIKVNELKKKINVYLLEYSTFDDLENKVLEIMQSKEVVHG